MKIIKNLNKKLRRSLRSRQINLQANINQSKWKSLIFTNFFLKGIYKLVTSTQTRSFQKNIFGVSVSWEEAKQVRLNLLFGLSNDQKRSKKLIFVIKKT